MISITEVALAAFVLAFSVLIRIAGKPTRVTKHEALERLEDAKRRRAFELNRQTRWHD